jgi:hypothetical protein
LCHRGGTRGKIGRRTRIIPPAGASILRKTGTDETFSTLRHGRQKLRNSAPHQALGPNVFEYSKRTSILTLW